MRTLLATALLIASTLPAFAAAKVADSSFFVVLLNLDGTRKEVVSDIVPLVPNNVCFGWRIKLEGAGKVVKTVEELTLPEPPADWLGLDEYSPTQISADKRTATTTAFVTPEDGLIENTWCIAPGDPAGPHSIRVSADGQALKTFTFTVTQPDQLH